MPAFQDAHTLSVRICIYNYNKYFEEVHVY